MDSGRPNRMASRVTRSPSPMSRYNPALPLAALAALVVAPVVANAQTRMLRSPTVSRTQIAFAYANNIWTVDRAGGMARRVTSFQGTTENPKFSPDGKLLAFSAQYAGNVDVYVVPAEGGEPKRLTWHPGARHRPGLDARRKVDRLQLHARDAAPSGAPRFWTVPVEGGVETPMALPRAYQGKISPDGRRIAYRMNNSWDEERRNYRGGQNRPIWIVDLKTYDLETTPNGTTDLDRRTGRFAARHIALFGADHARVEEHGSGLGEQRHRRLHLGSRRRGERLELRHEGEEARAAHELQRLRREGARRRVGRKRGRVRAGREHPPARSQGGQRARREHHGRGRLPVDDAAVEGRQREHDATSRSRRRASASRSKRAARSSRFRRTRATFAISRNSSASAEHNPAWSPDGKTISYFSDAPASMRCTSKRRTD